MKSVHDFNPFSEETIQCPYPFYEALRTHAPVYEAAPGVFFIAAYDTINQVLRDPLTFKSGDGAAFLNFQGEDGLAKPTAPPQIMLDILSKGQPPRDTLLSGDPPQHVRFRSLVNRPLSPGRVARLEPAIKTVVDDLIDAFIDDGEVELVSQFSMLVPLTVVAITLGVPPEDREKYKDWSRRNVAMLAGKITPEEALDSAMGSVELQNYIADKVEAARIDPPETLIGDLVQAHLLEAETSEEGSENLRPLDTPEIVSIVQQLLVAGQETVNYLITSLMRLLIENPDQMKAITEDFSLIPSMVEEGVRIESPIQALGRFATKDVTLEGVDIPAGARLVIMYGCANRDTGKFEQPARFNIQRNDLSDHVGFGAGPHYCIGSALARLESKIAFEQLFRRMKSFKFAQDPATIEYQYNFIFRAPKALYLAFEKA
jgi:cytochrome P450